MRILPVLDLQGGRVVRGIAGRRHEYAPIRSSLTPSSEPLDIARTFRAQFGLTELYLADLDAIAGAAPALATYQMLLSDGFALWVDAGVRKAPDAEPLADLAGIVVGLETIAGPATLEELCRRHAERVVFSLDLKSGQPLGDVTAWQTTDPLAIAAKALSAGVRRLIVLDLAQVGTGRGTGTEALCSRLATDPTVEVYAGGGVREFNDLLRLQARGVRGALIASALHDGRLSRADLEQLTGFPFPRG
jgi:phosphoribosylformimino-5-aminoimidazole carboxamide ribotide isomerase